MKFAKQHRKSRSGSVLIEIAIAYGALVLIGVLTLKATINASATQSWTVKQAMTDAYLTREVALSQRMPFDDVTSNGSLWGVYPSVETSTVNLGKLPGGKAVTATVHRTRYPDANNLASASGSGTSATNPGGTEAWQLQSLLSYEIEGRKYVKTRTTLRIR